MDLLVIRHAIAMERDDYAALSDDDDTRPLTEVGAKKMRRVAQGLRQVVERIDLLASSPLTRALETAHIVADAYGMPVGRVVDALRPENSSESVLEWTHEEAHGSVCALVGHEPNLGQLVTWLMTGLDAPRVTLKKGGACLLGFDGRIEAGAGTLRWLMTPSQLISSDR